MSEAHGSEEAAAEALAVAKQMQVCGVCGGLFGQFVDAWHGSVVRVQDCGCQAAAHSQPEARWPWFDFNRAVELCYCCAAKVIRTGSKWSVFFCEDCRPQVWALNRAYGIAVIPYGRHSMMNGFGMSGEDAKDRKQFAGFAKGFRSFVDRSDRLHDWRASLVRGYLAAMSEHQTVPVQTYLAAVAQCAPEKADEFHRLCAFFGVDG